MPASEPSARISLGSSVVAAGAAGAGAAEPIESGRRHERAGGGDGDRVPVNKFRVCRICGHHKGAWSQPHPEPRSGQFRCTMPADQSCPQTDKVYVKRTRKRRYRPANSSCALARTKNLDKCRRGRTRTVCAYVDRANQAEADGLLLTQTLNK